VSLENNRFGWKVELEFRGGLPDYSLLENLTKFDVSSNYISGTLPTFSENLKLQHLNVSQNEFVGAIDAGTMKAAFESSNNEVPFVLDLSFNRFEGPLPNFDVDMLNINVVGNKLDGIDPIACDHDLWNDGATSMFNCSAIACPVGTSNAEGRQTSDDEPCEPCAAANHYGTVGCNESVEGEGNDEVDHGESGVDETDEVDVDDEVEHGGSGSNVFNIEPQPTTPPSSLNWEYEFNKPPSSFLTSSDAGTNGVSGSGDGDASGNLNMTSLPSARPSIESSLAVTTSSSEPSSTPSTQPQLPTEEPTIVATDSIISGQYAVPRWQVLLFLVPLAFSVVDILL